MQEISAAAEWMPTVYYISFELHETTGLRSMMAQQLLVTLVYGIAAVN
jgi:hypothetical protein